MDLYGSRSYFILLVLLTQGHIIAVCEPTRKEFGSQNTGSFITGEVLASTKAREEMMCQLACHGLDNCDMYNFNTITKQCQLLDGTLPHSWVELDALPPSWVESRASWLFRVRIKCVNNNCKNGGVCYITDDGEFCLCSPCWTGQLCENKANIKEVFNFPRKSDKDYIIMREPFVSLSAFTVALWVQVNNSTKYHAPFTFQTPTIEHQLVFWLKRDDGTLFYIENQYGPHAEATVDNQWHHICLTWENTDGKYSFYIDGRLQKQGAMLQGHVLDKGALVLGQEGDGYMKEQQFEDFQAFQGMLTSFNLWNKALTSQEVHILATTCPTTEGNVIKWSVLKTLPVNGSVELICSPFCVP